MTTNSRGWYRALVATLALATLAPILAVAGPPPANAVPEQPTVADTPVARTVTGADFDPGFIISDALFYDGNAMSAAEIQSFLDAKIGRCTNGQCLNVVRVSPASQAAYISSDTGRQVCAPITGGTNLTVAIWIYRVQVACGLSAKAILVTLQKEQGLVTKTAPSDYALRFAMGMDCPDTTGCQTAGGGLASQIYRGSRQLVIYKVGEFLRQPGWHAVQFHPNTACGSAMVRIQNYATAALYNYTPYQPNAAALANLGGTGDSCSSYGNRNFWRYYNDWFGSTLGAPGGSIDGGPGLYAIDAAGDLRLYPATGKGSWRPASVVGSGWGALRYVTGVGDWDGDGHRDVVAVDAGGSLLLYPSDGVSAFGAPITLDTGWGDVTAVVAAFDADSDGDQDLLSRTSAGVLRLHRGLASGGIAPPVDVGTGWGSLTALFGVPDFTGDGRSDLIARDPSGRLWLYPGNGAAGWGRRVLIGSGWQAFRWIGTSGDFNGDRANDILAITTGGSLMLYRGTGRGAIGKSTAIGSGWTSFPMVTGQGALPAGFLVPQPGLGDLTGDGRRDILARDSTGALWTYPGNGVGGFLGRVRVTADPGVATWIGAGDVDRDGLNEVLGLDGASALSVHDASVAGLGSPTPVTGDWSGYDLLLGAGDLDGDHRPDLLGRTSAGQLFLHPGDGVGGYAAPVLVGSGWGAMTSIIPVGDFDADGEPDLLARDSSGVLWLYPGTGASGWYSRVQVGVGWQSFAKLFSPGDLTGDRIADLLAVDAAGSLWLYPGNGNGAVLPRRLAGTGWGSFTYLG